MGLLLAYQRPLRLIAEYLRLVVGLRWFEVALVLGVGAAYVFNSWLNVLSFLLPLGNAVVRLLLSESLQHALVLSCNVLLIIFVEFSLCFVFSLGMNALWRRGVAERSLYWKFTPDSLVKWNLLPLLLASHYHLHLVTQDPVLSLNLTSPHY